MSTAEYFAVIFDERTRGTETPFGVVFPDFPGCVTVGASLKEARAMAVEALGGHIACMTEAGEQIPSPATLDAAFAFAEQEGARLVVLVPVRVDVPFAPAAA